MSHSHETLDTVAQALLQHPACLILTHVNPEGDAIGSQLALALALEQHGITVSCYDRDGVPENCRFLPTWERVHRTLPETIPPLVVYVDADRLERCGVTREQFPQGTSFVRIDHHVSDQPALGPSLVDTRAAATGELIYALLPTLRAQLTADIATCLQTAIMVDTGRFSYTNTTPTTHHIAADLVHSGADVPTIVDWIWGRVSLPASKLRGAALSSLQVSPDGRIAWAVLRNEDFLASEAAPEDTDGIIDCVRNVRDTWVAVLFSEKRGEIRVSLRSRGDIDVAKIAMQFGGGGHVKAAGLSYDGLLEYAIHDVLKAIEQQLPPSR